MEGETELIKRGSIAEKVKAYNHAIKRIELAYEILSRAEVQLKDAFNAIAGGANLKPSN